MGWPLGSLGGAVGGGVAGLWTEKASLGPLLSGGEVA